MFPPTVNPKRGRDPLGEETATLSCYQGPSEAKSPAADILFFIFNKEFMLQTMLQLIIQDFCSCVFIDSLHRAFNIAKLGFSPIPTSTLYCPTQTPPDSPLSAVLMGRPPTLRVPRGASSRLSLGLCPGAEPDQTWGSL